MSIEIKGRVIKVGETQQITEKLSKREVVIETTDNPKYPQSIPLELVNDRADLANGISVGDLVLAEVNIRGRAWTKPGGETGYFLSLNVWNLSAVGGSKPAQSGAFDPSSDRNGDDIPF